MKKKLLIMLLSILLPAAASADSWSSAPTPGKRAVYSFTQADGTGYSRFQPACHNMSVGFKAATGGEVNVQTCSDESTCTTKYNITADTPYSLDMNVVDPYVRVQRVAAPSAGTSEVIFFCSMDANAQYIAPLEPGKAFLFVGDSWISGRVYDEPWAQYYGEFNLMGGGFLSRMRRVMGGQMGGGVNAPAAYAIGHVHYLGVQTSGNAFGADSHVDVVKYLREHPEIKDVYLGVGSADYLQAFFQTACSHGTPFDPNTAASGACTVDDTITNIKYLIDRMLELENGLTVFWQVPPAWLGLYQGDLYPGAATYQDAIERVYDEIYAHCQGAGRQCYALKDLYREVCAGDTTAPDPDVVGDCTDDNSYDYGEGNGLENKLNAGLMFYEDAIFYARTTGFYRVHASGYGYSLAFRRLMASLKAADPTLATRYNAFSYDWDARPAIPEIATANITTTSLNVTPTRGEFVDGNSGTTGKCILGACRYVCWATCVEDDTDSADPACYNGAETPQVRDYGAPGGAAHYDEGGSLTLAPRDFIAVEEGQNRPLRGLATGTDYAVVCVSISPTAISHPGVRIITTQ